jgi:L-rhamnose isomerase
VLTYLDAILLHDSQNKPWDSDHAVILSGDVRALAEEVVRGQYLGRVAR